MHFIFPTRFRALSPTLPTLPTLPTPTVPTVSERRKNDTSSELRDRPIYGEKVMPCMTVDRGSNMVHYLKPPYKAHVQLSLDRGARSGMDGCARTRRPRTATAGPRSTMGSTRSLNSVTPPRTTTRRPLTATGHTSAVASVKSLKTMALRSEDRSLSR